jgi:glycerol-3-phosphate acyltransferase PlsY
MAGISYPILLKFILKNDNQTLFIFSIFVAILLVITHKKNISRLLKKQESRVNLFANSKD